MHLGKAIILVSPFNNMNRHVDVNCVTFSYYMRCMYFVKIATKPYWTVQTSSLLYEV